MVEPCPSAWSSFQQRLLRTEAPRTGLLGEGGSSAGWRQRSVIQRFVTADAPVIRGSEMEVAAGTSGLLEEVTLFLKGEGQAGSTLAKRRYASQLALCSLWCH